MIKGSAILLAGLLVTWILRRRGAAEGTPSGPPPLFRLRWCLC